MSVEEIIWIKRAAIGAWVLPLLSFVIAFVQRSSAKKAISIASVVFLFVSTLCAAIVFISVWNHEVITITWNWFSINGTEAIGQLSLNNLSVLMLMVVNFISLLVHFYSTEYMKDDDELKYYFALLGFFTFAMIGVVLSGHLLLTFFFWELVGFSSYLLIGHWKNKPQAGAAATKAFLFNRIGDAGFLIGICLLWSHAGSLHFTVLEGARLEPSLRTWIGLLLFSGVIGKSAQFPLSTWLPDAMEGPTPASALIHAATMVAAGVFLLARVYFLFTPDTLIVVSIVGAITALWGALNTLRAFDIKKILAYSTVSQLGFMVLGMGSGSFTGSMMHLFTHAFFKAGLFLGAGAIIHYLHEVKHRAHADFDVQDIRNMGGLRKYIPKTFILFTITSASLAGIPFFSGFVSKDAILTQLFYNAQQHSLNWIFLITAFIVSFLTVCYTFRMVWHVFFGECRIKEHVEKTEGEHTSLALLAPMIILALLSFWIVVSFNPLSFSGWLSRGLANTTDHHALLTVASILWIIIALCFSYFKLRNKLEVSSSALPSLDFIYSYIVAKPVTLLSLLAKRSDAAINKLIHLGAYVQVMIAHLTALFDRVFIDGSVNNIARLAGGVGSVTRSFANGKIQSYILWATASLVIFILWFLLS